MSTLTYYTYERAFHSGRGSSSRGWSFCIPQYARVTEKVAKGVSSTPFSFNNCKTCVENGEAIYERVFNPDSSLIRSFFLCRFSLCCYSVDRGSSDYKNGIRRTRRKRNGKSHVSSYQPFSVGVQRCATFSSIASTRSSTKGKATKSLKDNRDLNHLRLQ